MMKRYYLVRFSKKTGKIDTSMSALGKALLQLWALQNTTTKTKDTIIFDEDGWVSSYYEGNGDFPNITKYKDDDRLEHIDDYCKGLLEEVKSNG